MEEKKYAWTSEFPMKPASWGVTRKLQAPVARKWLQPGYRLMAQGDETVSEMT